MVWTGGGVFVPLPQEAGHLFGKGTCEALYSSGLRSLGRGDKEPTEGGRPTQRADRGRTAYSKSRPRVDGLLKKPTGGGRPTQRAGRGRPTEDWGIAGSGRPQGMVVALGRFPKNRARSALGV